MDHAYHAELQAVRRQTYAALPDGLLIMASVDEMARPKSRPAVAVATPITVAAQSPAEVVIAAYCAARASSVSPGKSAPTATLDNMRCQLRQNGIEPKR